MKMQQIFRACPPLTQVRRAWRGTAVGGLLLVHPSCLASPRLALLTFHACWRKPTPSRAHETNTAHREPRPHRATHTLACGTPTPGREPAALFARLSGGRWARTQGIEIEAWGIGAFAMREWDPGADEARIALPSMALGCRMDEPSFRSGISARGPAK